MRLHSGDRWPRRVQGQVVEDALRHLRLRDEGDELHPAAALRPDAVMQAARIHAFNNCTCRPMQFAAARALAEGDAWLDEARRAYADAGRATAAVAGVAAPESGPFLFFDAAPFFRPGEALDAFLERYLDSPD